MNLALLKPDRQAAGLLRSTWLRYKGAPWGWHIVVPAGLAAVAGTLITWAWQVLQQGEYGVAMLLTFLFLFVGLGAIAAIPRPMIRAIGFIAVVVVALFSVGVIWKNKGDKPWTIFMQRELHAKGSRTIESPSPSRPHLGLRVRQTRTGYSPVLGATQVLLDLEISNSGESTIACCWHIEYHSLTMNGLIAIEGSVKDEPVYIPITKDASVGDPALEFEPWKSINLTTSATPIVRGVPVLGRLIALIPDNRMAEFQSGHGLMRISIQDYMRDHEYIHEFRAKGEDEPLRIQPSDKVIRMPKLKTQKQSRGPIFITRP